MILYRGRYYKNYTELSKRFKKTIPTIQKRLELGLPLEPKTIIKGWWNNYDGKFFKDLESLSKYYNIHQDQIRYRLKAGYSYKEALLPEKEFFKISKNKAKRITIGDKTFRSINRAKQYFEVDTEIIIKLSKGIIKESDIPNLKNNWNSLNREIEGKIYHSWAEVIAAYSENNLDVQLLSSRYSAGKREYDLIKPRNKSKNSGKSKAIKIEGKTFISLNSAATFYGIKKSTFYKRYKSGKRGKELILPTGKFVTNIK